MSVVPSSLRDRRTKRSCQANTIVHVGLPKTGTKLLQNQLFAHHEELFPLEFNPAKLRRFPAFAQEPATQLFHEMIWGNWRSPDWDKCQQLALDLQEPAVQQKRFPVISWEGLMEDRLSIRRRRAENLLKVFGPCKIIAVIRHPLSMVESLYFQLLKRDNIGGFAGWGTPLRFETIDQWLETNWALLGEAPQAHLEYGQTIRMYTEVFGQESVYVGVFEQLVQNPRAYVKGMCAFMGIDPEHGFQLIDGVRENDRWSHQEYTTLQSIYANPFQRMLFRYSPKHLRQQILRASRQDAGDKPKASVSAAWKREIEARTRSDNQWLQRTWQLPLDQYKYPL